jgi:hypothetical protein
MQKLKIFKVIFTIAAISFLAKPFLGFQAFSKANKTGTSHTVLVKSFSKRKPESLHDAYAKAESIRQNILNPPVVLLAGFLLLLATTLAAISDTTSKLTTSTITAFRWSLFPPQPAYLLSGKLII